MDFCLNLDSSKKPITLGGCLTARAESEILAKKFNFKNFYIKFSDYLNISENDSAIVSLVGGVGEFSSLQRSVNSLDQCLCGFFRKLHGYPGIQPNAPIDEVNVQSMVGRMVERMVVIDSGFSNWEPAIGPFPATRDFRFLCNICAHLPLRIVSFH